MADPKHPNPFSFVLDGADNAVVADSISPQPDLFAAQRLPESVRILLACESFSQIAEDSLLDLFVEARQLFEGSRIELNRPSQAVAPLPR